MQAACCTTNKVAKAEVTDPADRTAAADETDALLLPLFPHPRQYVSQKAAVLLPEAVLDSFLSGVNTNDTLRQLIQGVLVYPSGECLAHWADICVATLTCMQLLWTLFMHGSLHDMHIQVQPCPVQHGLQCLCHQELL